MLLRSTNKYDPAVSAPYLKTEPRPARKHKSKVTKYRAGKSKPWKAIKGPGRVTKFPGGFKHSWPVGLTNPNGAYCYRRALLQCLIHLPAVYNYLGSIPHQSDCERRISACVVCGLQTLVNKYWNEKGRISFPREAVAILDKAIRIRGHGSAMFPDAETNNQGDPHDLFMFLHDQLERNEFKWSTHLDRLFSVYRSYAWECEDCGGPNQGNDPVSVYIPIPLAGSQGSGHDLDDHIEKWFYGEENRTCNVPNCNGTTVGTPKEREIDYWITQSPEVLCINLQRQAYNHVTGVTSKIHDEVPYPEVLDLSEYTEDE